jgi:hypothetical protein
MKKEEKFEWNVQEICVGVAKEIDEILTKIDQLSDSHVKQCLNLHCLVTSSFEEIKREKDRLYELVSKMGGRLDSLLDEEYLEYKNESDLREIRLKWKNLK